LQKIAFQDLAKVCTELIKKNLYSPSQVLPLADLRRPGPHVITQR